MTNLEVIHNVITPTKVSAVAISLNANLKDYAYSTSPLDLSFLSFITF